MNLEQERPLAPANLQKVQPLTAISNQRRALTMHFIHALNRPPYQIVARIRAQVSRMAADTTFRDVDLTTAFNVREGSGCLSRSVGLADSKGVLDW